MFDGEAFGKQMVEIVRGYVDAAVAPISARNADLEARNADLEARLVAIEQRALPERGEPGEKGEQGPAGEVDMDAVASLIADAVAKAVAEIPAPERGEKGEPGERGEPGADGANGIDGKDGAGLADALLDSEGNLVLTLSDGRIKKLGRVVGRDGIDGQKGEPGATFTLDDFDITPTDERTIEMSFTQGNMTHSYELEFPVPIYRGVFNLDEAYVRGDMATWGGSLWHCEEPKGIKPDAPDSGWKLVAKKGRDGKDLR